MTQPVSITLDLAHEILGWPEPNRVIHPEGAGASVYASLVHDKIGRSLGSSPDFCNARLGVLMTDPDAATSEPPLAIVQRNGATRQGALIVYTASAVR